MRIKVRWLNSRPDDRGLARQMAGNEKELVEQLWRDTGDGGDEDDADAGNDNGVFDRGGSRLVREKDPHTLIHDDALYVPGHLVERI